MDDQAPRIFWIAALIVSASLFVLEPYPPALAWAALGGVGLAVFPIVPRLIRKPRKHAAWLAEAVQLAGATLFFIAGTQAYHVWVRAQGGEDAVSAIQWLAFFAQSMGTALLVMALLIVTARWRWPERFERARNGQNGDW